MFVSLFVYVVSVLIAFCAGYFIRILHEKGFFATVRGLIQKIKN